MLLPGCQYAGSHQHILSAQHAACISCKLQNQTVHKADSFQSPALLQLLCKSCFQPPIGLRPPCGQLLSRRIDSMPHPYAFGCPEGMHLQQEGSGNMLVHGAILGVRKIMRMRHTFSRRLALLQVNNPQANANAARESCGNEERLACQNLSVEHVRYLSSNSSSLPAKLTMHEPLEQRLLFHLS